MSFATDILALEDKNTGVPVNYRKTTVYEDGSPMDISKTDGVIYRKLGNDYYKRQFEGAVNVKWFGAKVDGVTDDSEAFQKCIDSFFGYFGGEIFIDGKMLIRDVKINKPGFTLVGLGNRISQIVGDSALTLTVHPLFNGNPMTNSGFGGFNMRGVGIYASSVLARNSGIGIRLINCFNTNIANIYAAGFKKNIELCGSHFNSFPSMYAVDEAQSGHPAGDYTFNQGYAISVSRDVWNGEPASTSLMIMSGWNHVSAFDLENLSNGVIENIDMEPGNGLTNLIGEKIVFRNCRIERLDYFALVDPPKFPRYNWFTLIGNYNRFENCDIHALGANNVPFVNARFKVLGNNNYIDFIKTGVRAGGLDFDENSKGNTVIVGVFQDNFLFGGSYENNQVNMEVNGGIFEGQNNWELREYQSKISFYDKVLSITSCKSIPMANSSAIQGLAVTGNAYTLEGGLMRIICNFNTPDVYEDKVYAIKFKIKSDDDIIINVRSAYTSAAEAKIKAKGEKYICVRFNGVNQGFMPTLIPEGSVGDSFELSEFEILEMDANEPYVPNFHNI